MLVHPRWSCIIERLSEPCACVYKLLKIPVTQSKLTDAPSVFGSLKIGLAELCFRSIKIVAMGAAASKPAAAVP